MLKLNANYSDYTDIDSDYPLGKAINASGSDSYDGTPLLESFMNDLNGAHIAMYEKAYGNTTGITGNADTQKSSQFVDAIDKFVSDKDQAHDDLRGVDAHGATVEATAGQLVTRDDYGRAKFAAPLDDDDAARKTDVDTLETTLKSYIDTALGSRILVGEIKSYAGIVDDTHPAPIGWLLCDGREVSKSTYSALYEVIGDKYGTSSTTENFVLPDYRECVLVGAGQNEKMLITTHDVYSVGEFKDDQFQGHEHNYQKWNDIQKGDGGSYVARTPFEAKTQGILADEINGTPRIGATTHGKQIGVNFLIRY